MDQIKSSGPILVSLEFRIINATIFGPPLYCIGYTSSCSLQMFITHVHDLSWKNCTLRKTFCNVFNCLKSNVLPNWLDLHPNKFQLEIKYCHAIILVFRCPRRVFILNYLEFILIILFTENILMQNWWNSGNIYGVDISVFG